MLHTLLNQIIFKYSVVSAGIAELLTRFLAVSMDHGQDRHLLSVKKDLEIYWLPLPWWTDVCETIVGIVRQPRFSLEHFYSSRRQTSVLTSCLLSFKFSFSCTQSTWIKWDQKCWEKTGLLLSHGQVSVCEKSLFCTGIFLFLCYDTHLELWCAICLCNDCCATRLHTSTHTHWSLLHTLLHPHTHYLKHTHTLLHTLSHIHPHNTLSIILSHKHSHTLYFTHSLLHTRPLTLSHSLIYYFSLSHTLSHTRSLTLTLSLSLTQSLKHTISHTLSLTHTFSHILSFTHTL